MSFWGSHTYKICFSPVNLFYFNLIIRPAKDPRRKEGKVFPPQHPSLGDAEV